ncbi:MAG: hypothetical protein J6035_03050 [Bacteroidaceae bacterium]|nr:hypothetical protein [Bacteroidaceae bacterium]
MNTQLLQGIGAIADDESLMKRLTKYVAKLVREKKQDPTLFSKEEFFHRIDESLEQARQGKVTTFDNIDDMNAWLNSL